LVVLLVASLAIRIAASLQKVMTEDIWYVGLLSLYGLAGTLLLLTGGSGKQLVRLCRLGLGGLNPDVLGRIAALVLVLPGGAFAVSFAAASSTIRV
jgi:hypothetical protein